MYPDHEGFIVSGGAGPPALANECAFSTVAQKISLNILLRSESLFYYIPGGPGLLPLNWDMSLNCMRQNARHLWLVEILVGNTSGMSGFRYLIKPFRIIQKIQA